MKFFHGLNICDKKKGNNLLIHHKDTKKPIQIMKKLEKTLKKKKKKMKNPKTIQKNLIFQKNNLYLYI